MNRKTLCQCNEINDVEQVCNKNCRDKKPKYSLANNGTIIKTDSDGVQTSVQPDDTVMKGSFTCQDNTAPCNVFSLGKNEDGDSTYDYGAGATLEANFAGTNEPTERLRVLSEIKRRRNLQETTKITNPVMCIKQYDSVLFEITDGRYPVYLKNSILNSNEDFDYGPFLQLAKMVEQTPEETKSFSYSFLEKGIYVFGDSANNEKVTIIGVVLKD